MLQNQAEGQNRLPTVAVLLAAYNGVAWIREQLDSILSQSNVDVSIYISIDPSTDGTEAYCASYSAQHANVSVLPGSGRFGGAARNFFRLIRDVDFAAFDYIAFSDQDDVWLPDKLARAVTKLQSGDVDAYSSNVIACWPSGRRLLVNKAQPRVRWDHLFEAAGPGCTYVLARRLADDFKEAILSNWEAVQQVTLHDWYCYAFARSRGFKWFIDPISGMNYRQHGRNQIGANSGIGSFVSRLRKINSGWWPAQVLLINELTENSTILSPPPNGSRRLIFIRLIPKAYDCRRRPRDKFLFILACLVAALTVN